MTITRIEHTNIPNTPEGREFAAEYEQRLRSQNAFRGRRENTVTIVISAEYTLGIKVERSDKE